jgi:hypothetical protein
MSGRTLPTTSTTVAPSASSLSPGKKTNVGAIAGGAVGGALVLIGLISGVLLCLRRRRRKQPSPGTSQPPEVVDTSHTRSDMAPKSLATASIMQGSTLATSTPHSPPYSLQGSPPPPASTAWGQDMHMPTSYYQGSPSAQQQSSPSPQHQSGEWAQGGSFVQPTTYPQGTHTYQQTYYPPPAEPSTYSASPTKEIFAHRSSVQEMPNVRSPANAVAEMSDVRSPAPRRS